LIREALAAHGGRRTQTARRLGVTREGLYKKMQRLGIA
jgi:DNA-binding NtrC family response regulator